MYEHNSAFNRLRITENDGVRTLSFERNLQSSMRLDDAFSGDIEYVDYLHLALAVRPDARRTLVLGLGGGSVVKRMWRDYPDMRIDAVEVDAEVVDVARAFFALPDDRRISVTVADGRAFVQQASDPYDIVIVDAFDDDRIPRPLMTEEFLRECRDILKPDGVIAYNIIGSVRGDDSRLFRSFHRTISNVWRKVWVFAVAANSVLPDRPGNIVVLATDAPLDEGGLLDRIRRRAGGIVTVPGYEGFADDLDRGPFRSGDVPLIVDPPARRR